MAGIFDKAVLAGGPHGYAVDYPAWPIIECTNPPVETETGGPSEPVTK
jgi:hypothetical protein